MDYAKEIADLKARLEKLEPKPEPKLPTEIGSHVRAGDWSREWVKGFSSHNCWAFLNREDNGSYWDTSEEVLEYCASHGGFTVGKVVWE